MKRRLTVFCLLFALLATGCTPKEDAILTVLGPTASSSSSASSESTSAAIPSDVTTASLPITAGTSDPATTAPVTTASAPVASSETTTASTSSATPEATPATTPTTAPETTSATTPATTPETTPVTTPATTPETTSATTPATTPETTSATTPATTPETTPATTPETSAPKTSGSPPTVDPVDPSKESYLENSSILYAAKALTLYQNGETVPVEADTALLCTGIGESFARVRWQGAVGYVLLEDTTEQRPQSAVAIAAEKGGIYYKGTGPLIAIDAGHQDHAMRDTEPLGPGSSEMKAKLSSGTQGVATRLEEYKLNLAVALLLRDELIGRGYSVVMIRETNNVDMSNAERALIANAYEADAFIRIHANGSENSSVRGAYTLCPTAKNPYNGNIYPECKRLSETILDKYIDSTGFEKESIWYTDTMTGLNWASVPVTLIEMGYMSNADEDRTMATEQFQRAAAIGMADGFDEYFGRV